MLGIFDKFDALFFKISFDVIIKDFKSIKERSPFLLVTKEVDFASEFFNYQFTYTKT